MASPLSTIKYCCYHCAKVNTAACPSAGCYDCLGGREHYLEVMKAKVCHIENRTCVQSFTQKDNTTQTAEELFAGCWEKAIRY